MGDIKDQSWAQNFAFYKRKSLKQGIALTGRNHTGPSCSVGRPTTHTPGRGGTDLSTRPAAGTHGRKSRGKQGGRVPQNLEWEDAKICKLSPDFVMLFQNFTHQITCITMQRSKKRINPIILQLDYSYFQKMHLQFPPNHLFERKIQHFSGKDTNKKYRSECTKTRHLK